MEIEDLSDDEYYYYNKWKEAEEEVMEARRLRERARYRFAEVMGEKYRCPFCNNGHFPHCIEE